MMLFGTAKTHNVLKHEGKKQTAGTFRAHKPNPHARKKKSESKKTDAVRLTLSGTDKLQTQVTEVLRFFLMVSSEYNPSRPAIQHTRHRCGKLGDHSKSAHTA